MQCFSEMSSSTAAVLLHVPGAENTLSLGAFTVAAREILPEPAAAQVAIVHCKKEKKEGILFDFVVKQNDWR